jgi:biotin operon repressor
MLSAPMPLRPALQAVVDRLLAQHATQLSLDRIGDALGTLGVSTEEVEAIFAQLESHGREVTSGPGGRVQAHLKRVIDAARALKAGSDARPTLGEVAARAELSRDDVLGALFLLRVMQRR